MTSSSTSSFFDIEPLDAWEISCRHAMDACSLCRKRLATDCDIYMYRGDTPFCSEECRCIEMVRDKQARSKIKKSLKDRYLASKEQQRRRHETPPAAAAESGGRVKLAADVYVAT